MKKNMYIKPAIRVVLLNQSYHLLQSSPMSPAQWGGSDPNNPYDFE